MDSTKQLYWTSILRLHPQDPVMPCLWMACFELSHPTPPPRRYGVPDEPLELGDRAI